MLFDLHPTIVKLVVDVVIASIVVQHAAPEDEKLSKLAASLIQEKGQILKMSQFHGHPIRQFPLENTKCL